MIKAGIKANRYLHQNREGTIQAMMQWMKIDKETAAATYDGSAKSFNDDGSVPEAGLRIAAPALVVQGTAGTTEDHIKYSWNVSMVIAKGQSLESMIPSPIMTAMEGGVMQARTYRDVAYFDRSVAQLRSCLDALMQKERAA